MRKLTTWSEPETGLIHCDGYDGNDYVLCGVAVEGENGDSHMRETIRRVTCPSCISLIQFCKAIPAGRLALKEPGE